MWVRREGGGWLWRPETPRVVHQKSVLCNRHPSRFNGGNVTRNRFGLGLHGRPGRGGSARGRHEPSDEQTMFTSETFETHEQETRVLSNVDGGLTIESTHSFSI